MFYSIICLRSLSYAQYCLYLLIGHTWLSLQTLRYSLRVSSSCSISGGIRRVTLVTNPVISHECGQDRKVLTTSIGFSRQGQTADSKIGMCPSPMSIHHLDVRTKTGWFGNRTIYISE